MRRYEAYRVTPLGERLCIQDPKERAIISRKLLPIPRQGDGWRSLLPRKLAASLSSAAARFSRRPPPQLGNPVFFEGFDKVTRSAGVRIWEWDVVHNTMQFSGDRAELYGTELEAAKADADDVMLGKVHPDDRPRYRKEFIKALKGEAPMEIEYRVMEHDGTVRPVQLRGEVFATTRAARSASSG